MLRMTRMQVCMDVLVQRLGDAAAAGIYKILQESINKGPSAIALCALPVCNILLIIKSYLTHI